MQLIQSLEVTKRPVPHYARFIAGLILRSHGKHTDALTSFRLALDACPTSVVYMQQVMIRDDARIINQGRDSGREESKAGRAACKSA